VEMDRKLFTPKALDAELQNRSIGSDKSWVALRFVRHPRPRLAEIYFHPARESGCTVKHEVVQPNHWAFNPGLKASAIFLLLAAHVKGRPSQETLVDWVD